MARLRELLVDQKLPERWVSGLVDRTGRVIARVPEVTPGTLTGENCREESSRADEGWYRGKTIEGHDSYTAFLRSRFSERFCRSLFAAIRKASTTIALS